MTLFNPDSDPAPDTATVVDGTAALDTLVGEGKKFKTIEDLAKGKLEADNHIRQTQSENANMRVRMKELEDQLNERDTIQDFLNEIRQTRSDDDPVITPDPIKPVAPREVDINKLIDDRLQDQRRKEIAQENVSAVEQELVKTWGNDYRNKLIVRAKELGLSHEFLGGVAEKSPKAFLELVGVSRRERVDPNIDVPVTTRVQQGIDLSTPGVRNQAYYDKLKKQDVKTYRSQAVQAQMHKDAQRLGDAFFN